MVNKATERSQHLNRIAVLLRAYIGVVVATLVALGLLSVAAPTQAPQEAWIHAVIVAIFAVVLPLRARSAIRGSIGGLRAVGLISAVLLLVNVLEALLPDLFPVWMRIEMIGIAALMAAVVLSVVFQRLSRPRSNAYAE